MLPKSHDIAAIRARCFAQENGANYRSDMIAPIKPFLSLDIAWTEWSEAPRASAIATAI
jgi:hypothetical protein